MNSVEIDLPVKHGFLTRHIGAERVRVAQALEIEENTLVTCKQVHSAKVVSVAEPWPENDRPEADAMVTDRAGLALGVLTADCAPVLFSTGQGHIVGAAHAGWRGALDGVLENTIAAMVDLGAQIDDVTAAIGPCISHHTYEVSLDFRTPFLHQSIENTQFFRLSEKEGHLMFDLPGYVAHRLRLAGLGKVIESRHDTFLEENDFFSYRRCTVNGTVDEGRQVSVIVAG